MSLCCARVPNKWYHTERDGFTGPDHPCPFKARKDGYCDRHHPHNLLPILRAKHARLSSSLAEVEAAIARLPEMPTDENPVVHSPS